MHAAWRHTLHPSPHTHLAPLLRPPACTSACRTVAVIAESRAWCMSLSGGLAAESKAVQRQLSKLAGVLQNVLADNALGACERAAAVDALLWLQVWVVGGRRQAHLAGLGSRWIRVWRSRWPSPADPFACPLTVHCMCGVCVESTVVVCWGWLGWTRRDVWCHVDVLYSSCCALTCPHHPSKGYLKSSSSDTGITCPQPHLP